MPPLSKIIYVVCERTAPGYFGEPFNTLSGLTFLMASLLLFMQFRKQVERPRSVLFLIIMVAVIGLGSSIFHSTARMWAAIFADALPIVIFILAFIPIFARHVLGLKPGGGVLMILIFIAVNIIFKSLVHRAPDGFISAMPVTFYMILIALFMFLTKNESRICFGLAVIIAGLATAFRILDWPVCDHFAPGMHFMWHSMMAVFMYLAVREVMRAHSRI